MNNNILKTSENCWKIEHARRASILVDGEAYFQAVHSAMSQAKRSIMIIGWDVHSELRLLRNGNNTNYPDQLGKLLDYLIKKRKNLQIYLLSWDFSMIYTLEREFFPRYKIKWRKHKRIHFCLDGNHPVGASQHQKIVVIDDHIAFAGGFDLSKWRWDTSAHDPDNELRMDPDGKPYRPFHDVQMVVDGPAAEALGQLAKDRWYRAFGEELNFDQNITIDDPWPENVNPQFRDAKIAISRTFPEYKQFSSVREVEKLYLDSIAQASDYIYIENQYLSSFRIGEALKKRLEQDNGPEIVIVMPRKTDGWLEQNTMGVLRHRLLKKLKKADKNGRLEIFYPQLAVNPESDLMVHAKLMIIDDQFVRVGSSNLSNRSLGLDSECDLAVFADKNNSNSQTIINFRNRLLAEHLGTETATVEETYNKHKSLLKTIHNLDRGERTLKPLNEEISDELDQLIPDSELLDPEKPIEPKELFNHFISEDQQRFTYRNLIKIILIIVTGIALAAMWRWTSLGDWLEIDAVVEAAEWVKQHPFSVLLIFAAYIVGGLISFPLTILVIATAIIFGPLTGFFYALIGAELNALAIFFLGRWIGQDTVSRFAGSLINRLNNKLSKSGLIAVITFRIIPVAPFSVINIIAGVSDIRLRDFALGTLIGLLPGILAIVLVSDRISASLDHFDMGTILTLFATIVLIALGLFGLRKWFRTRKN